MNLMYAKCKIQCEIFLFQYLCVAAVGVPANMLVILVMLKFKRYEKCFLKNIYFQSYNYVDFCRRLISFLGKLDKKE